MQSATLNRPSKQHAGFSTIAPEVIIQRSEFGEEHPGVCEDQEDSAEEQESQAGALQQWG